MTSSARAVQDISISDLTVSQHQVRKRDIDKDISELVENIRIHGQLEPIVVAPTETGEQFEIIAGQRRWIAMQELGHETISAVVLDEALDEGTARALSISENMIRHDVDSKDLIDACTDLYRKYGSVKAVAEDLGLPQSRVRTFVKFERLRPSLKEYVEQGELDVKTAVKVEDHCAENELEDSEIDRIITDIKGMTNAQKTDYFKSYGNQQREPSASGEQESPPSRRSRRPGDVHQILMTLPRADYNELRQWANDRKLTQDQAAARIIHAFFRSQQQRTK